MAMRRRKYDRNPEHLMKSDGECFRLKFGAD